MIGGPSDVVVETNIVRGAAVTGTAANGGDGQPRRAALRSDARGPCSRSPRWRRTLPAVAPPGMESRRRALRRAVPTPVSPSCRRQAVPGFAPCARPTTGRSRRRSGTPDRADRRSPGPGAAATARLNAGPLHLHFHQHHPPTDQSLAEMAQRLEAALRRPTAQKVVTETQRVTATVEIKAAPPKTTAPPPRANAQRKSAAEQSRTRNGEPFEQTRKDLRSRGFAACVRLTTGVAIALLLFTPAHAQDISISFGQGQGGGSGLTERVIQLIALLTVLSLAPSILVMMTSFTRIVVVLSLLRTALGTATAPPNAVIMSLSLFLTAFVMGPAFQRAYDVGIKPMIANEITAEQAFERSSGPFKEFMLKNVRDKDLKLFNDLAKEPTPAAADQVSLRILIPAFMISELKRAFEIGFLLFLPFLIIDLVVASVLMSMGMMMLPPVVVSLPFKLIFFVLVDGWSLVAGSLVQSYGGG